VETLSPPGCPQCPICFKTRFRSERLSDGDSPADPLGPLLSVFTGLAIFETTSNLRGRVSLALVRTYDTTYKSQLSKIKNLVGVPYSSLTVGIPREIFPNERRVALTPQNAALLRKKGFSKVFVEHGAGADAQFLDEQYVAAGATLVTQEELFATSDIVLKVRPPLLGRETEHFKEGSTIISFLYPAQNKLIVDALAARKVNVLAMDMIPRISRAQVFDALRYISLSCFVHVQGTKLDT
jgi:hypothetical protein